MQEKQCTKCNEIKPLQEFNKKAAAKDGLQYQCRECHKKYCQKNKERIALKAKQWRADNKEKIRDYQLAYQRRPEKRARKNELQRGYVARKIAEDPNWLKKRAEKYDGYNRYVKKDEDSYQKWLQQKAEYKRLRRKTDPAFKLRCLISTNVYDGLHKNHCKKNNSTWQALPYTPEDLRCHLESQFTKDMNWDNHGTYWHIDHIIPQAALPYDSMEHPNFLKCWSLDNLQPLPAKDNVTKGSLYEGKRYRYGDKD